MTGAGCGSPPSSSSDSARRFVDKRFFAILVRSNAAGDTACKDTPLKPRCDSTHFSRKSGIGAGETAIVSSSSESDTLLLSSSPCLFFFVPGRLVCFCPFREYVWDFLTGVVDSGSADEGLVDSSGSLSVELPSVVASRHDLG